MNINYNKKNKANNKEEKNNIKRPEFIIFTDRDGTLNLDDKDLNKIFNLISTMKGMVIPTTGRTVGDIQEGLQKKKIKVPEILVGDNGANVYSTKKKEFIIKKHLEHEKVMKIIDYFLANGGNLDYLRYTDGNNIFASNEESVNKYYKNSNTAQLSKDIYKEAKESEGITKITLAGSKELMQKCSEYVNELGFWTDMDKTKFPTKDCKNFRLDIAQKNISKGKAVEEIVEMFKPKYGYLCVGNGNNDLSMFKKAVEDNMMVAIMGNAEPELINEVKEYSKRLDSGKVVVVPNNRDLANKFILRMAKLYHNNIRAQENKRFESHSQGTKKSNKTILPSVQRININNQPKPHQNIKKKKKTMDEKER